MVSKLKSYAMFVVISLINWIVFYAVSTICQSYILRRCVQSTPTSIITAVRKTSVSTARRSMSWIWIPSIIT